MSRAGDGQVRDAGIEACVHPRFEEGSHPLSRELLEAVDAASLLEPAGQRGVRRKCDAAPTRCLSVLGAKLEVVVQVVAAVEDQDDLGRLERANNALPREVLL